MQNLIDRFCRYVKIDTESDPNNTETIPSTQKQFNLAKVLVEELEAMGMQDVTLDDHCYIMATLPSNIEEDVPTIGFVAHVDTSPDFTGVNVNPQIHKNYDGNDIVLNKEKNIVLSADYFPALKGYKGQTIITTDGTTLLGADDKAGVTEIVTAMEYLLQHPEIKHGKIRICFTPDEEIGKGADLFDVKKFGADWAYTMDGGQIGELEYENFNAAGAKVTINGTSVHPGYAKNKMVNSLLIASEFIAALPAKEIPQETEGYEGFYHLGDMKGDVEKTTLRYIIRDHDFDLFQKRKVHFQEVVDQFNKKLGKDLIEVEITNQYFNMKEKIEPVMYIIDIAEAALIQAKVTPDIKAIRGGTDGSRLSYMGLPCPNIFAGGHNFHGKFEFVPVESMQKAVEVIVNIAQITVEYSLKNKDKKITTES